MANLISLINSMFGSVELLLIQLLVFLAVALAIGGIVFIVLRRNPASKRLSKLLNKGGQEEQPVLKQSLFEKEDTGLVAKVAAPLHNVFSPSAAEGRKKIRIQLLQAGITSIKSYRNYLALKVPKSGYSNCLKSA